MEKVKNWIKKHKKHLIIGGSIAVGAAALYFISKNSDVGKLKSEMAQSILYKAEDITIPDAAKDLGVYEYFQEEPFTRCLMLETFPWKLGDLGNLLIDNLEANPDCPVAITLEYANN